MNDCSETNGVSVVSTRRERKGVRVYGWTVCTCTAIRECMGVRGLEVKLEATKAQRHRYRTSSSHESAPPPHTHTHTHRHLIQYKTIHLFPVL
jgi:hypothetical protein